MTSSDVTPVLVTDRLRMRGHRADDLAACAAMWADANVVRYIGGTPSTSQQTWMRLLNYVGHWTTMGFGYWLVEEKHTGRFVGEVGFADFKRGLMPSLDGVPEIGWAVDPGLHRKGYATEAVRAALDYADARAWKRTFCIVSPGNTVSLRIASRFDFDEKRRIDVNGRETIVLERDVTPGRCDR